MNHSSFVMIYSSDIQRALPSMMEQWEQMITGLARQGILKATLIYVFVVVIEVLIGSLSTICWLLPNIIRTIRGFSVRSDDISISGDTFKGMYLMNKKKHELRIMKDSKKQTINQKSILNTTWNLIIRTYEFHYLNLNFVLNKNVII